MTKLLDNLLWMLLVVIVASGSWVGLKLIVEHNPSAPVQVPVVVHCWHDPCVEVE